MLLAYPHPHPLRTTAHAATMSTTTVDVASMGVCFPLTGPNTGTHRERKDTERTRKDTERERERARTLTLTQTRMQATRPSIVDADFGYDYNYHNLDTANPSSGISNANAVPFPDSHHPLDNATPNREHINATVPPSTTTQTPTPAPPTRPRIRLTSTTDNSPSNPNGGGGGGGFLSKIKRQLSKGNFVASSSSPAAASGPEAPTVFLTLPTPSPTKTTFHVPPVPVPESTGPRDSFASTLGTASVSIPDMPCFAPNVPSQAGVGVGYYAREFDMDRESGSGSVSGSETGSGSETDSADTRDGHTHGHGHAPTQTKNQRKHAKRRHRGNPGSRPHTAGSSSDTPGIISNSEDVEGEGTSSPSDYSCDSAPPSASASVSAFAFPSRPSEDGSIITSTSTVSYIGSSASFFMGLRASTDAGEGEGKGSFESSLSGSGFESIVSQASQVGLELELPQPQPQPEPELAEEEGSTYTPYVPLILQHERVQQRLQVPVPLVGFEGDADASSTASLSLSLRRSGSASTSGSRGSSRSKSKSRHGQKEKEKRPSSSRSGSSRSSSGSRVNSRMGSKEDLSKLSVSRSGSKRSVLASASTSASASVTSNTSTSTSQGSSKLKARSRSTNFKPPAQRPVPNYSPPRTPIAGVAQLVGQTPTQTQIQAAVAQVQVQAHADTQDSTDSQIHPSKPHGTGQSKPKGRKRTKKIPPPLHPEPSFALPLPLAPPGGDTSALPSPNSTSSKYVSANETPSQTSQPPYPYHYQPASPTSTASTKSPVTPCTPLFGQQQGTGTGTCQPSPGVGGEGEGEEVGAGRSSCSSDYLSSATGHSLGHMGGRPTSTLSALHPYANPNLQFVAKSAASQTQLLQARFSSPAALASSSEAGYPLSGIGKNRSRSSLRQPHAQLPGPLAPPAAPPPLGPLPEVPVVIGGGKPQPYPISFSSSPPPRVNRHSGSRSPASPHSPTSLHPYSRSYSPTSDSFGSAQWHSVPSTPTPKVKIRDFATSSSSEAETGGESDVSAQRGVLSDALMSDPEHERGHRNKRGTGPFVLDEDEYSEGSGCFHPHQHDGGSKEEMLSSEDLSEPELELVRTSTFIIQSQSHLSRKRSGRKSKERDDDLKVDNLEEEDMASHAADDVLKANTLANANINAHMQSPKKIGVGRQVLVPPKRNSRERIVPGKEWTLFLGPGSSKTKVEAEEKEEVHVPEHSLSVRGRTKSESSVIETRIDVAPKARSGIQQSFEDWTLSLPLPAPKEWRRNISGAPATVTPAPPFGRHSDPLPRGQNRVNIMPTTVGCDEGSDESRTSASPSDVDSLIFSAPPRGRLRVEEVVLCVPRVVSSGSGLEDASRGNRRERTVSGGGRSYKDAEVESAIGMGRLSDELGEERECGDDQSLQSLESVEESGEDESLKEDEDEVKTTLESEAEKKRRYMKDNLAKLDALSADLANFNELLKNGVGMPSRSGAGLVHGLPAGKAPDRLKVPSLTPPTNLGLKHARSCGMLEVQTDEPPPKNAVLRMPSVDGLLAADVKNVPSASSTSTRKVNPTKTSVKDKIRLFSELSTDEHLSLNKAGSRSPPCSPLTPNSDSPIPNSASAGSRFSTSSSATAVAPSLRSTATTKIRGTLPFAPPPSSYARSFTLSTGSTTTPTPPTFYGRSITGRTLSTMSSMSSISMPGSRNRTTSLKIGGNGNALRSPISAVSLKSTGQTRSLKIVTGGVTTTQDQTREPVIAVNGGEEDVTKSKRASTSAASGKSIGSTHTNSVTSSLFNVKRASSGSTRSTSSSNSSCSPTPTATSPPLLAGFPVAAIVGDEQDLDVYSPVSPSYDSSPLPTPLASSFPSPPPLLPTFSTDIAARRPSPNFMDSRKPSAYRPPSTALSVTSMASHASSTKTVVPGNYQVALNSIALHTSVPDEGDELLATDVVAASSDDESMLSGTYYSARSSFDSPSM